MRVTNKVKAALATVLIAVGAFFAFTAFDQSGQASAAGCSPNSVVKCGVWSVKEMRDKYNSDYTKGTKTIYSHLGVTSEMVNKYRVVEGMAYRDGTIKVGGKTVATNAYTAGRTYLPNSTKHTKDGITFYTRTTQVSFVSYAQWETFVFLNQDGQFVGGVIKDCGNPIQGKNVVPKPTYECKSLTAATIDRLTRKFYVTATATNGAKVTKHVYNFGDGQTRTVATNSLTGSVNYKYAKAGTYTATVDVYFTVGTSEKKSTCKVTVTVKEEPKVERCDLETGEIVEVTETEAQDPRYTEDLSKCDDVKVCDPETGEIITVKKSEEDNYLPVDSDECKVEVCDTETGAIVLVSKEEATDERYTTVLSECDEVEVCDTKTGEVVTVEKADANNDRYADVNDPACQPEEKPEEKPEPKPPVEVKPAATELPETGLVNTLSSVFGLGSLTAATYYYLASRRS